MISAEISLKRHVVVIAIAGIGSDEGLEMNEISNGEAASQR